MTTDAGEPGLLPVAGVVVDSPLAHLDRIFEYAVPPELATVARPGVRVRVRFAAREVDGFVVSRAAQASHPGVLTAIRRVVSDEPVLTPALLALTRAVADHYGGTLADVLRLAIPKRHAAAERALPATGPDHPPLPPPHPGGWAAYPAGPALLRRVLAGQRPAAAWVALPGQPPETDWPTLLATAAAAALATGQGALLTVPDHRDVQRVDEALTSVLGPGRHVRLTADQGPQARYTAWLKVLRGHVRVVVGTRAAAFAPVRDLGLIACWDDGDDLYAEPRTPYPHLREILAIRAEQGGAALLFGGFARSVQVQAWVAAGRLVDVRQAPERVRRHAARIELAGEYQGAADAHAAAARLPPVAWRAAQAGLRHGPVLVQVPRGGYLPAVRCGECRSPARCADCHGPLTIAGPAAAPICGWCGHGLGPAGYRCPTCDGRSVHSSVIGSARTAEELGRAFPAVPVLSSAAGHVLARVPETPALVVATPGAEPIADGGYAAALVLDAWASLDRPGLDASVEAVRRWSAATALVRGAPAGGRVVVCGVPPRAPGSAGSFAPVEALVRWDPVWLAALELAEREVLALPPTVRMAELTGARRAVQDAAEQIRREVEVVTLGPLPIPGQGGDATRIILRASPPHGPALARALASVRATRSARKDPQPLAVRMDWPGDG